MTDKGVDIPGNLSIGGTLDVSTISSYQPIPSGIIVMWSGTEVPDGWALCDGTNGTPDLIGMFVRGNYAWASGTKGGSSMIYIEERHLPSHTHTITDPGHSHTGTTSSDGSHSHNIVVGITDGSDGSYFTWGQDGWNQRSTASAGTHSHSLNVDTSTTGITVDSTGSGDPVIHMPPYYSLAYIMKL